MSNCALVDDSGRKKRSQDEESDGSLMDAQMDNGSRSEEDRKAAESQEEIYDDIWRYLRGNNKIR